MKPVVVQLVEPFWQVLSPGTRQPELFRAYGKALSFAQETARARGLSIEVHTGLDRFDVGPGDRLISKTLPTGTLLERPPAKEPEEVT